MHVQQIIDGIRENESKLYNFVSTLHTYIGSGSMWNMAFQFKMAKKMKKVICLKTYPRQFGVRSLCRRFLNQLETWVIVSPVFLAKVFFSSGVGYRLILYVSFRELRDFSLKQYTVSSPSQMVRGRGNLRLSLYLSTAPVNMKKHSISGIFWHDFSYYLYKKRFENKTHTLLFFPHVPVFYVYRLHFYCWKVYDKCHKYAA